MHTLLIIPAANQAAANAAAAAILGTGNTNTFRVPLYGESAMEDTVIIAYWAAIALSDSEHAAFAAAIPQWSGALLQDYDMNASPGYPMSVLSAQQLRLALVSIP